VKRWGSRLMPRGRAAGLAATREPFLERPPGHVLDCGLVVSRSALQQVQLGAAWGAGARNVRGSIPRAARQELVHARPPNTTRSWMPTYDQAALALSAVSRIPEQVGGRCMPAKGGACPAGTKS